MHLIDEAGRASGRDERTRERLVLDNQHLRRAVTLQQNLTSMVAHDLRNPIACVSGYLDLLARSSSCAGCDQELIRKAEACLLTLNELVTSLLDVSRLEDGRMPLHLTDVSVGSLAREALTQHVAAPAQARRVRLLDAHDPDVASCDPNLIRRVIANLVANALKYSPADSSVEVHVESGPETVHVDVQDHGPGIPRRYQGRIFEKFHQLDLERAEQPGGVGLGLTFCKLAVEAHGGHMGLESDEGRGSRFWFDLPTHGPHASAVA